MVHEKLQIQVPGSEWKADLYTYFLDNSVEMHPHRKRITQGKNKHCSKEKVFRLFFFHTPCVIHSVEDTRYHQGPPICSIRYPTERLLLIYKIKSQHTPQISGI